MHRLGGPRTLVAAVLQTAEVYFQLLGLIRNVKAEMSDRRERHNVSCLLHAGSGSTGHQAAEYGLATPPVCAPGTLVSTDSRLILQLSVVVVSSFPKLRL